MPIGFPIGTLDAWLVAADFLCTFHRSLHCFIDIYRSADLADLARQSFYVRFMANLFLWFVTVDGLEGPLTEIKKSG